MGVKRRIIWVEDDDWARLTERAKAAGMTPSAYIRSRAIPVPAKGTDVMRVASGPPAVRPVPKPSQRKR